MASRIVRLALAALLGTTLIAMASPAQAADTRVTITFKAQLANVSNNTSTFGDLQYGTTTLQGASLVKGEEVLVRRDSVVEYVDGTGPIGGFLTVTWKDGSRISMRVAGSGVKASERTDFTANLDVFSTAGRWKGYVGHGIMRGARDGDLGTPVIYTYRVTLTRIG